MSRASIVAKHSCALEDGVAVARQLAFREHEGTCGIRRDDRARRLHIIDPLDQQDALRVDGVPRQLSSLRPAAFRNGPLEEKASRGSWWWRLSNCSGLPRRAKKAMRPLSRFRSNGPRVSATSTPGWLCGHAPARSHRRGRPRVAACAHSIP